MASNQCQNPLASRLADTMDSVEEQNQVVQFLQAALTKADVELTPAERQGLFTVMEWQRERLLALSRKLAGAGERLVD